MSDPAPTYPDHIEERLARLEQALAPAAAPRANPPTSIGPFLNVPAPGSPIRSDWPQQISHYVYDTPGVVKKNGDTMTGLLNCGTAGVQLPPSAPTGVQALRYDIAEARYLYRAGDTATANINVGAIATSSVPGVTLDTRGLTSIATNVDQGRNIDLLKIGSPAADAGQIYVRFYRGATAVGSITVASATAVAYNTTSDPRVKRRLGPIGDAVDRVRRLGARAFRGRWRDDPDTAPTWDFLSSHDVEDVAPYAVNGARDNDDLQQVDQSALVPLLMAAVDQLAARIDHLETRFT